MGMRNKLAAGLIAAALSGCIVTPAYQPPPAAPAVAYESDAQVNEPPPPLPVYEQPPCPEAGYLWTPGLWRWGPQGYFWVPGTWVAPPQPGLLWTPGFWGVVGAVYVFHGGYWGPHVGFYGGINYGGGYVGNGYAGGRWVNNNFQYNTAVTNVNVTNIHNTYNQTVINNTTIVNNTNITQTSYAGGPGTRTTPTPQEAAVANEPHVQPTSAQVQHETAARANPALSANQNQGHPPIAATTHPGSFSGPGVTAAKPVGPAWHPATPPAAADTPHAPGAMPAHAATPATPPQPQRPAVQPPHPPGQANQQKPKPQPQQKPKPKPKQAEGEKHHEEGEHPQ